MLVMPVGLSVTKLLNIASWWTLFQE